MFYARYPEGWLPAAAAGAAGAHSGAAAAGAAFSTAAGACSTKLNVQFSVISRGLKISISIKDNATRKHGY